MGVPRGHGLVRTSHGKVAQVMARIECKLYVVGKGGTVRGKWHELFITFGGCSGQTAAVYWTLAGPKFHVSFVLFLQGMS